jgi:hypothetical protein
MHMLVTRRRHLGVALEPKNLRGAEALRVGVEVMDEMVECLHRQSRVAKVRGAWPNEAPPFPMLMDVTLSAMGPTGFILSGVEEVDGALYAQSWWCREQ